MLLKETIAKAFGEQQSLLSSSVPNEIARFHQAAIDLHSPQIQVIAGVRRCGKSTLLRQLIRKVEKPAYFNFEDVRIFDFEVDDFTKLEAVMGEASHYFFDEIQNVDGWEVYIRQLHDRNKRVIITGSNASLLSIELGTRLTGRYTLHELYPFSYQEYLQFKKLPASSDSTATYLREGGFPVYLLLGQQDTLQQLLKDILYRDIAVRHRIRNAHILVELALYLATNTGKLISYNSLRKMLGVGSTNSVSDYIHWMQDAYILQTLEKFSWSAKERAVNPKKVYFIDTGLAKLNSQSFSEDTGRLLENAVYLQLRRTNNQLFYYSEKKECDFLVFDGNQCKEIIQVTRHLDDDNLKREIGGLIEAAQHFSLNRGLIITLDQEDNWKEDGIEIDIIPFHRWVEGLPQ